MLYYYKATLVLFRMLQVHARRGDAPAERVELVADSLSLHDGNHRVWFEVDTFPCIIGINIVYEHMLKSVKLLIQILHDMAG